MDKDIIYNLYEFWSYIGRKTEGLTETEEYKAVSMKDSDWPNRIFSISNNAGLFKRVISLSQKKLLPNIITIQKPNDLHNNAEVQFMFGQKNMALDLRDSDHTFEGNENIREVGSLQEATYFASTASEAFGYRVDPVIANMVNQDPSKIKIFNYVEQNEYLACGIIFFDSINNAGLHMIGTIPKGRGKGIGKKMTEKLLWEAVRNGSKYCVLHASKMGESIYSKLGFTPYGELETYKIKTGEPLINS